MNPTHGITVFADMLESLVTCICPGCGTVADKRALKEGELDTSQSFCTACGYEITEEPWRLPSVRELVTGEAGSGYSNVDLGKMIPALLRVMKDGHA